MLLISIDWPLCKSFILFASVSVARRWYAWVTAVFSPPWRHGNFSERLPHLHFTVTFTLHDIAGHCLPEWQAATQGWPQSLRGSSQGCKHGSSSLRHGGLWQILRHLCPQFSSFPHSFPHETSFTWHGMLWRTSWSPIHFLLVNIVQGGHISSLWHVWFTGWWQAWILEQGFSHSGGEVPHGIGGYKTVAPQ